MEESLHLSFSGIESGDRVGFVKWMRQFYEKWHAFSYVFDRPDFPVKVNFLNCMKSLLEEGSNGKDGLIADVRDSYVKEIFSEEKYIVAIEGNHIVFEELLINHKYEKAGFVLAVLAGDKLDESTLTVKRLEMYHDIRNEFKALVSPEKDRRGGEGWSDGEEGRLVSPAVERCAIKIVAMLEGSERKLKKGKEIFDQTVKDFDGELSEFKQKWNDDFALVKAAYDSNMALQAPVRYWDNKRKKHEQWALRMGVFVLVAMLASVWALYLQIGSLNQSYTESVLGVSKSKVEVPGVKFSASNGRSSVLSQKSDMSLPREGVSAGNPNNWHFDLALLLLEATLCFWVIRIGVRMLLSQVHLENDAAERVTMAQTYIALMRRGKLPEGDDLKTVLAALFRPSGDGIVKDEGIPPSMMELLTKLR
ncbi:hypothetical protein HNO92_004272 [Chromobacterium alkanivorans]|uniref:hypothetical protein n=1 Tax=Chromobacterium alkanivorans TaxID=1071719 RepID=UPI002168542E|nr:hypothetical protein [Chromobacterium alkanivorans]MCS3806663.1 hypothetical protein [Chromobacterium alkanivorans]MCS3821001.1 hypothetical protein [Chromobacterium alkanivorans]MCS3875923.1 hypothetical protein [Chromobacterium alkanivorans]